MPNPIAPRFGGYFQISYDPERHAQDRLIARLEAAGVHIDPAKVHTEPVTVFRDGSEAHSFLLEIDDADHDRFNLAMHPPDAKGDTGTGVGEFVGVFDSFERFVNSGMRIVHLAGGEALSGQMKLVNRQDDAAEASPGSAGKQPGRFKTLVRKIKGYFS